MTVERFATPIRTRLLAFEATLSEDLDPSPVVDFPEPAVDEADGISIEEEPLPESEREDNESRARELDVVCTAHACDLACSVDAPRQSVVWTEVEIRRQRHATTIAEVQLGCADQLALFPGDGDGIELGAYTVHIRVDDAEGEWQRLISLLQVTSAGATWIPVPKGAAGPVAAASLRGPARIAAGRARPTSERGRSRHTRGRCLRGGAAMIAAILGLLHPSAQAAVEVCIDVDADYNNAEVGAGDYWTSDAIRPLQGVEITLSNTAVDESKYADSSGSSAGCATFDVPQGFYWVSITSKARLSNGNNTILVLDVQTTTNPAYPVGSGQPFEHVFGALYTAGPGSSSTYDYETPATEWSRVLAASAHALQRRAAGLSNTTFRAWTNFSEPNHAKPCDGACFRTSSRAFFTDSNRKFVIVHELGHAIGSARNAWMQTRASYGANPGTCVGASTGATNGHSMDQKEYQSASANEGFAHYYAAVAFNNSGHADCTFAYYKDSDYDLDGTLDPELLDCEGGPDLTPSGTGPGGDWMGSTCSTPHGNRSSEYDWLRFFWDLDTNTSTASTIHTTQIGHIWDQANPYSWRRKDEITRTKPWKRVDDACDTLGYNCSTSAYNGVEN